MKYNKVSPSISINDGNHNHNNVNKAPCLKYRRTYQKGKKQDSKGSMRTIYAFNLGIFILVLLLSL